ncbi:FIST N-terminal domain-containing protein [Pelagibius sp.]|uniref:FIST N-terminal domain-containing protein n=1 Tax=Pelagibius sp. TaxID=1931238 RepID=UPI003B513E30
MDAPVLSPAAATLAPSVVKTAHAPAQDPREGLESLARAFGGEEMSLVVLFVSPSGDLSAIAAQAASVFGDTPVIGCSTAGEISPRGYTEDEIVAVGFSKDHFVALIQFIADLKGMVRNDVVRSTVKLRGELARLAPQWTSEFAFLMVDGLSLLEDQLVSALSTALGPTPLFGGSAGDGLDFKQTFVIHEGRVHRDAAVLALIRTDCAIKVFNFDHLTPTERKMVVTEADPDRRVVREINGEPAAREYARLVGMDPEQLSPFIFAAHPVVVKVGGKHHVRAIQKVEPNGDLTFFSAIDEGLVLTLAEPRDIAGDLDSALGNLALRSRPEAIIACDCILRRVEAAQKQSIRALSAILSANRVVGFSTYGEQLNSVHVNQTMTGIAIYPPPAG